MTVALPSMAADPHEATRALLLLAQQEWESGRSEVDARRRRAITAALDNGMTLDQVAEATGLSRNRVHQIKHGTR